MVPAKRSSRTLRHCQKIAQEDAATQKAASSAVAKAVAEISGGASTNLQSRRVTKQDNKTKSNTKNDKGIYVSPEDLQLLIAKIREQERQAAKKYQKRCTTSKKWTL